MGVARRSCGGVGRARFWPSLVPFTTGLACGEGGIERPRRGVRLPLCERAPGMGGRRRGAGDDMAGGEEAEDGVSTKATGCIYIHNARWDRATGCVDSKADREQRGGRGRAKGIQLHSVEWQAGERRGAVGGHGDG